MSITALAVRVVSEIVILPLMLLSAYVVLLNNSSLDTVGEVTFGLLSSPMDYLLVLLTIFTSLIIILAKPSKFNNQPANLLLNVSLATALMVCFKANHILIFYVFFEVSLLPIFIIVIGWGYQPERLNAAINLMLYTVAGSLPLLVVIVIIAGTTYSQDFDSLLGGIFGGQAPWVLFIASSLAFLIKLPIYLGHL